MRRGRNRRHEAGDKEAHDEGAVLLTTLLILSLMATLAVTVMEDVTYAVRRAVVLEDTAQAESYLEGAEGFVVAQLRDLKATLDDEELNPLFVEPQVYTLPVADGGIITLTVSDATHCVSPGDVSPQNAGAERRFTRTLVEVGVPRNEAAQMTAALLDWQDADNDQTPLGAEDGSYLLLDPPYRTPGTPVSSVSELRAVRGFDREIWEAVAPWMCISNAPGAGPNRINVNTLPLREASLLAANLAKDTAFAQGLLAARPAEGWTKEDFDRLPGIALESDAESDTDGLSIENISLLTFFPEHVRVDIRVAFRDVVRRAALRVDISGPEPVVVHRMRGGAALPMAKFPPEEGGNAQGEPDNG